MNGNEQRLSIRGGPSRVRPFSFMLFGMKQSIRPDSFTDKELSNVGVKILEAVKVVKLQCEKCGIEWTPKLTYRSHLPKGYWKCPNECNVPQES